MSVCEGCDREITVVRGRCPHCGAGDSIADDLNIVGLLMVPGLAVASLAVVLLAPEALPYGLLAVLAITVLAMAIRAR